MTITVTEAKNHLEQLLAGVQQDGQRIVIETSGEISAALDSLEDLARLERLDAVNHASQLHSLANTVIHYDNPFEPVADTNWLDVMFLKF